MNQKQIQPTSQHAVNSADSRRISFPINIRSSIALSILAHLLALMATQSDPQSGRVDRIRPTRLDATLNRSVPTPTAPSVALTKLVADTPNSSSQNAPPATTAKDDLSDSALLEGPRLIGQPDFSAVEKDRVAIPINVRLLIVVSAAGLAESVTILESEPVPSETLEKIKEAFQDARYWPARDAHGAQSARMEITVNIFPYGPFAPISPEVRKP